jgi:hypothetical protein
MWEEILSQSLIGSTRFFHSIDAMGQNQKKSKLIEPRSKKKYFNVDLSTSIENSTSFETSGYPLPFIRVITFMEKNSEHEGIYRLSGNSNILENIINQYETGKDPDLNSFQPIDVMGLLRLFLKGLSEPLATATLYPMFSTSDVSLKDIKLLTKLIPDPNKHCLKRLVKHLKIISSNEVNNKMTPLNLSVVFSFSIFWNDLTDNYQQFLMQSSKFNSILALMIENYDEIFCNPVNVRFDKVSFEDVSIKFI